MASGYVTSDGKDLDQRYLAIGGTANAANSVPWSGVTGKPSMLTTSSALRTSGAPVNGSASAGKNQNAVWTAPSNGLLTYASISMSGTNKNGHTLVKIGNWTLCDTSVVWDKQETYTYSGAYPLLKGQQVLGRWANADTSVLVTFVPVSLG